jgi:hypothetical protein
MARLHRSKVQDGPKCRVALPGGAGTPGAAGAAAIHGCPRGSAAEAGGCHLTVASTNRQEGRGTGMSGSHPVAWVPTEQVQADPLAAGGTQGSSDAQAIQEIQAGHLALGGVCLSKYATDSQLLECQNNTSNRYLVDNPISVHPIPSLRLQGTIGSNDTACKGTTASTASS